MNIKTVSHSKQAICASKLYRTSTRKKEIMAAMNNPINIELITQLDEYIGEDYEHLLNHSKNLEKFKSDSDSNDPSYTPNNTESTNTSSTSSTSESLADKYGDELDADGNAAFDTTQMSTTKTDTLDSDTDDNANSSTHSSKSSINCGTDVILNESVISLSGLSGEIKGTLNARSETIGVDRCSVKNNELWVYYNDSINLNNVMSCVIDILNATNYHYLIFNRLARSDNAIVFVINSNDTLNVMETTTNG